MATYKDVDNTQSVSTHGFWMLFPTLGTSMLTCFNHFRDALMKQSILHWRRGPVEINGSTQRRRQHTKTWLHMDFGCYFQHLVLACSHVLTISRCLDEAIYSSLNTKLHNRVIYSTFNNHKNKWRFYEKPKEFFIVDMFSWRENGRMQPKVEVWCSTNLRIFEFCIHEFSLS